MPYEYPADEFDVHDDERNPVGVHRAPKPAWHAWAPFVIVIICIPLLAWGAVALMSHSGSMPSAVTSKLSGTTATSTAESAAGSVTASAQATDQATDDTVDTSDSAAAQPGAQATTPTPSADLTTGVTIHNGGNVNGLATRTGSRLEDSGYSNVAVESGVYAYSQPTTTTIYYAAAENEATAQAIGQILGIANVVLSPEEAQSNPIVIVLRSDFQE